MIEMNKNSIISKYLLLSWKLLASKKSGEMFTTTRSIVIIFFIIQIMANQSEADHVKKQAKKNSIENQNNLVNCQRYLSLVIVCSLFLFCFNVIEVQTIFRVM